MYIEIKGVQFSNKGAELMLHAILQKVGQRYPAAKFVMGPNGNSSYTQRAKLQLYQKLSFAKNGVNWGVLLGGLLPKKFRDAYGLVTEQEINVVLDASGFAYTDKWGINIPREASRQFKQMKKKGAKIILLPQSFGPFRSPGIRDLFSRVVENSDIIFARDAVSYDFVKEMGEGGGKLTLSPDFTNLVKGFVPDHFRGKENRICIIPNYRMIDKTDDDTSRKYVPFMAACIQELLKLGERPFFLIHEVEADFKLAEKIMKNGTIDIEVVRETDALAIKGIIGSCKGMIGSRFHGLVSALSQGVPALATTWSHKYEMLFSDYEFPEGILSLDMDNVGLRNKLDMAFTNNTHISRKLLSQANSLKQQTENMWKKVFMVLDGHIQKKGHK